MKMNKKASILDVVWIGGFLLAFCLISLISYKLLVDFNDNSDQITQTEATDALTNIENASVTTIQTIFFTLFMGLSIFILVMAFFIRSHPIFFVIGLILLAIFMIVFNMYADIYTEFASSDQMSGYTVNFTIMNYIMQNLEYFLAGLGFLVLIVLYIKRGDV